MKTYVYHISLIMARAIPAIYLAFVGVLLLPSAAYSGWNPIKTVQEIGQAAGEIIGAPAGGLIDAVTKPTIRSAENSGHRIIADMDQRMEARIAQIGDEAEKALAQAEEIAEGTITQIDESMEARIAQIDESMEERIYQLDGVISKSLLEVDRITEERLQEIDQISNARIKDIDVVLGQRIDQIDNVMEARIDQVDIILDDAIVEVDQRIEERISQLDEIAETRIGNAEIVATKASLSLESAITRIIGFACLMAFVTFLFWRIFVISRDNWNLILKESGVLNRVRKTWELIGPRLLLQGGSGLVAAAIIYLLFLYFPGSEQARIVEIAKSHEQAFEESLAVFDFRRTRFHASQLQLLIPNGQDGLHYRGLSLKADLIRDILTRPGLIQTPQGLTEVMQLISRVEGYLPDDPDVLAIQAYVSWNTGTTRDAEYEAARVAALAIGRGDKPRYFALLPLAVNYLDLYSANPLPDKVAQAIHEELHSVTTGEATEFMSIEELRSRLDLANAELQRLTQADEGVRIASVRHIIDFNVAASSMISTATTSYFAMLKAHAEYKKQILADIDEDDPERQTKIAQRIEEATISVGLTFEEILTSEPPEFSEWNPAQQARFLRLKHAYAVVDAWKNFDSTLRNNYWLADSTTTLAAFRLNDALYSRAAWFVFNPNADELAPTLTGILDENGEWIEQGLFSALDMSELRTAETDAATALAAIESAADPASAQTLADETKAKVDEITAEVQNKLALRLKMAPPRLVWIERYKPLLGNASRAIVNYQEYERFRIFEMQLAAFDEAYLQYLQASGTELQRDIHFAGRSAAEAAARLGFYVRANENDASSPLAFVVLEELKQELSESYREQFLNDLTKDEVDIANLLRATRTPLL